MALAKWSSVFSVGIKEFDAQHQNLLDISNRLHDAMAQGRGREVVGPILREILEYTQTHFAAEEARLRQAKFPGLVMHKAEHDLFINRVNGLVAIYQQGKGTVSIETMGALRDWLVQHIMGTDKQYTPFVLAAEKEAEGTR